MKTKWLALPIVALLLAGAAACYRHSGYHFYPNAPIFAPTDPARVDLLRREPRREHVRLGEVWIRPTWHMDRFYVEGMLREKAARMGADALVIVADRYFREGYVRSYWRGYRAVNARQIVGIAIRYNR